MKYLRQAIRSCSGLLLAGAVLLQVNFLPAQAPSAILRQSSGQGSGQAIPIAVVEFEGNGISQTEAIALTDRLRNELFRLGVFEVVERGMMETILTEQDFQLTGCTSNECLVEVGQLLGARQVVGGRISRVGAMFTVSARVVDVQTGKLLGVSDFDLRGGLEEMLTDGMKQVAVMLSGDDEVVDLSRRAEMPETQATPLVGLGRYRWQLAFGFETVQSDPIYSVSYFSRREFSLGDILIRPAISLASFDIADFIGMIEAHTPFVGEKAMLSLFIGGGFYDDQVLLPIGAQAGIKLSFLPLIVGELRLILAPDGGDGFLTPGVGIRL